ncbi:MAG: L,D-transpeptidase family protein [Alphaproteobacteria bacterium]|nr:L,D-transpeptidase family protein [Alphaproteobacteria bacterium]
MTATTGTLEIDGKSFDCTLGRNGVAKTIDKKEGDGKTPLGDFSLREVFYRADRVSRPETRLPVKILTPETGWCDDSKHPDYNKKIKLPHNASHEVMTREDNLYNIVAVIGYNYDPVIAGKGSAIFLHLAQPDFSPTAGCIGLRTEEDIRTVLKQCDNSSRIKILPPQP